MKFYRLWARGANKETASYLVKMEETSKGVLLTAAHPWKYWIKQGWVYSAIKYGWTGPASDSIEWNHEEISEDEFNAKLNERGMSV